MLDGVRWLSHHVHVPLARLCHTPEQKIREAGDLSDTHPHHLPLLPKPDPVPALIWPFSVVLALQVYDYHRKRLTFPSATQQDLAQVSFCARAGANAHAYAPAHAFGEVQVRNGLIEGGGGPEPIQLGGVGLRVARDIGCCQCRVKG